jgi:hypothetical protein
MHQRKLRVAPAVVALVLALAQPVAGQTAPTPSGNNGQGGRNSLTGSISLDQGAGSAVVSATATSGQGGFVPGVPGSGGVSNCAWTPDQSQTPSGVAPNGSVIAQGQPGQWWVVSCNGMPNQLVFVPSGGPGPAMPSPQQLLAQARAQLVTVAPTVLLSPASTTNPAVWQYVNIPTWAWVDRGSWVPVQASASAGPVTVTAVGSPRSLVLSYEDGLGGTRTVTCNGPGTPFGEALATSENRDRPILAASPDCGWVWEHSAAGSPDERLVVSAHVVYDLAWTVTGAPGGGPLGPLDSPTSTYRITVGEVEAVITGGR